LASRLEARNLAKRFGQRVAVADISVEVRSGEIVGLLGPNGAGKTTSFYMIVGLIRADAGTISLDGDPLTSRPMHERARLGLGYLPQEASVFRGLSVADNLLAILELDKSLDRDARTARCEQLLDEFHLQGLRAQLGQRLSGGERRRVEIARVLASRPKFVLLDEPFAGVDPISVSEIKSMVRDLAHREIGVLITDHNVRETLDLCDRAYIVNEGKILAEGTTETILANETVRNVYLGAQFHL
jgi:lipopolysaccharide export system ATP-binding protein